MFAQKKYSATGVYEMIQRDSEMLLDDIYAEIEESGELSVYDKDVDPGGTTRYKHIVRGHLQDLKNAGKIQNIARGLWAIQ